MRLLIAAALAAPLLLGGTLALDSTHVERWPSAGAWLMPVGEPYGLETSAPDTPPFRENRGVKRRRGRVLHQGSDLANGRSGDTVRAAAHGIVLKVSRAEGDGYGDHIVLAHRNRHGDLHYTVYAHLLRGSMRASRGEVVAAGQPIARVGSTGRSSSPHLHFEIRECRDPSAPWELSPVLDPLPFIAEHLPTMREDGSWARRYLEWGERSALLPAGTRVEDALSRERWWRMLAQSAVSPLQGTDRDAGRLRDTLIALGVLPAGDAGAAPGHAATWSDLGRDIRRLNEIGVRLPPAPEGRDSLRAACERWLGREKPSERPKDLSRLEDPPTVGLVCLLLADLAGHSSVASARVPGDGEPDQPRSRPRKRRPKGR